MQTIGPALLAGFGFLLMLFCMYTEGEPTALPLAMILAAAVWYVVARFRKRPIGARATDR